MSASSPLPPPPRIVSPRSRSIAPHSSTFNPTTTTTTTPSTTAYVTIPSTPATTHTRKDHTMKSSEGGNNNNGSMSSFPCASIPRMVLLVFVVMAVIGANWYLISQYLHEMHETHVRNPRVLNKGRGNGVDVHTSTHVEEEGGGIDTDSQQSPPKDDKALPDILNFQGQPVPTYSFDKGVWPFTDMDDVVARNIDSKYFGPPLSLVHSDLVSNNNDHQQHRKLYKEHEAFFEATGCNIIQVPFDPMHDEKCIQYYSNRSNWEELKPLPMEFDQRTVKFEVVYKPIPGSSIRLATMLKVPQRLFPYEAFSEVAAFNTDRVLGINRVPPTTWSCIPENIIRTAVTKHGSSVGTVKEFLDDSKVANYLEWIEKDFFKYNVDMRWSEQSKDVNTAEGEVPERCFRMSMQVRVADVGHLLDTALTIPYKAHNDSWQRFLNIIDVNEHKIPSDVRSPLQPLYASKKFVGSIIHISELNMFDWVIGNDDRSPNKNNFVVGGCRHKGECADVVQHDKLLHPGPPTFIHLDQGMSFYGKPKRNGMSKSIRNESAVPQFCVFRAPLINRLEELGGYSGEDLKAIRGEMVAQGVSWEKALEKIRPKTILQRELSKRIPKGVKRFVDDHAMRKASGRLHEILRLVRRCLAIETHTELRRWVITP